MEKSIKNKRPLLFKKIDIAIMLNVDVSDLNYCLSDSTKKEIGWQAGRQMFKDTDVLKVLKEFRGAATHEQLLKIVYPMGF